MNSENILWKSLLYKRLRVLYQYQNYIIFNFILRKLYTYTEKRLFYFRVIKKHFLEKKIHILF